MSFTPSNPELTTYTEGIPEDTVFRIDQDTGQPCCKGAVKGL